MGCKDCKERTVGCHATCEKYKQFKAERDKQNADRRAFYQHRGYAHNYEVK